MLKLAQYIELLLIDWLQWYLILVRYVIVSIISIWSPFWNTDVLCMKFWMVTVRKDCQSGKNLSTVCLCVTPTHTRMHACTHARTHAHYPVSCHQKGKTNLDFLEQDMMSGNGISWTICKSAPWPRHITTPASHHSIFYRPDALPVAQPTASKCWRQQFIQLLVQLHFAFVYFILPSLHCCLSNRSHRLLRARPPQCSQDRWRWFIWQTRQSVFISLLSWVILTKWMLSFGCLITHAGGSWAVGLEFNILAKWELMVHRCRFSCILFSPQLTIHMCINGI